MTVASLATLASGQQPFATILGCSDSRVPPELVFDAGLGELFVVRVAGNVMSSEVAGSLQYAGSHLRTPLFVVLGHDGCGAVAAALETRRSGALQLSRIRILVDSILSGLDGIDPDLPPSEQLSLGVERNVRWTLRQIAESPEGQARLREGQVKLKGGIYDLASGRVRWLDGDAMSRPLTPSTLVRMAPRLLAAFTVALALAPTQAISGQAIPRQAASGTGQEARPDPPSDRFGRSTPRGTVLGFLSAARSGDNATAAQYLNTKLPQKDAEELAQQLFVILDTRLPARLAQLSTEPEGSGTGPLGPDRELVGTIARDGGEVPIVVERVASGSSGYVWLFARATLAAVPDLYEEASFISIDGAVPQFLVRTRVGGLRLFDWLAALLGLPLLYLLMVLLNRLLSPAIAMAWRGMSGRSELTGRDLLPTPARLLLLAVAVHWLASVVRLPLFARQFWFSTSVLIAIASAVWLGILFNGVGEQVIRRRLGASHMTAVSSLLRLARRFADIVVIFIGVLVLFRRLSIDPTPALAGLGVGGIAVALAAQKTLENVIGGMSLIFDRAVTEGDFLKVGETVGIGRSRRPSVHPHPHARSHRGDGPEQPDCEHEPRDALGS